MKSLTGLLLIAAKLYCVFKIFQWFYFQYFDHVSHPISEIQHILVFFIFDLWLMASANQIKDEVQNFKV